MISLRQYFKKLEINYLTINVWHMYMQFCAKRNIIEPAHLMADHRVRASMAWTVFSFTNVGIVGLNPTDVSEEHNPCISMVGEWGRQGPSRWRECFPTKRQRTYNRSYGIVYEKYTFCMRSFHSVLKVNAWWRDRPGFPLSFHKRVREFQGTPTMEELCFLSSPWRSLINRRQG
jgi:hypothetical protein